MHSSGRSGPCLGSTNVGRSVRGSTGSSSTAVSIFSETERRLVAGETELARLEWHDVAAGDQELLDAVAGLSLQRRIVVVLRYGLAYTPTAIAELLGIPAGTVNSRLARALEELRADYEVNDVSRA
jgi:RNA polymerase sigma factor (sigma-70 family)